MTNDTIAKEVIELLKDFGGLFADGISDNAFNEFEAAIADWARKRDEQKCMDHSDCNWKGCALVSELQTELAALHRRLAEAERERDDIHIILEGFAASYPCHCAQNYPGSTEYHSHDCANAVVQEFVARFVKETT